MAHRIPHTHTVAPDPPSLDLEQLVRERAYQLYEERGCQGGHALDDWLRAEAEVLGVMPGKKPSDSAVAHEQAATSAAAG
jgi:Protein of unknown function (DUF2934)